jgi:hypothetical protein
LYADQQQNVKGGRQWRFPAARRRRRRPV